MASSKAIINSDISNESNRFVTKHRANCKKPLKHACNFCGRKFTTIDQRKRHEKSHIEKPYACKVCDARFDFKVMLRHHLNKGCGTNTNDIERKCATKRNKENDKKFASSNFNKHRKTNVTKHFQCKACRKIFPTNGTYEKHYIEVHIVKKPKCHKFQNVDEQDEHTLNSSNESHMYPCNICIKEFSNIDSLNSHKEMVHHVTRVPNYDDNFEDSIDFGTTYAQSDDIDQTDVKPSLSSLDEAFEEKVENDFDADEVPENKNIILKKTSVSKKSSLRKSIRRVSYEDSLVDDIVFDSDNEKKSKRASKNLISKHSNVRSSTSNNFKNPNENVDFRSTGLPKCYVKLEKLSEREFADLMGRNLKVEEDVGIHCTEGTAGQSPAEFLKKIGIEPRAPIGRKCNFCDAVFLNSKSNVRHMKLYHTNLLYKCKDCEKSFKSKFTLSKHYVDQHAGVKFFKCRFCERTFHYKDALNQHLRGHFEGISCSCDICGELFIDSYELNIHSKSHRSAEEV